MYSFDIQRPTSVADAVAALGTDEAQALGGGQTLIPTLKQRLAAPSVLVSLSGIAEMQGICTMDDGALSIGGGTTHAAVAAGAGAYPALAHLAGNIGDPAPSACASSAPKAATASATDVGRSMSKLYMSQPSLLAVHRCPNARGRDGHVDMRDVCVPAGVQRVDDGVDHGGG